MSSLQEYIQLCWFRKNPLELQPSQKFFVNNLLFYLGLGIIVEANISDPADAVLEIGAETIVTLILVSAFLLYKKQLAFFKPLLTALIIAENFIFTLGILTEILDVYTQKTEYEDYPAYIGAGLVVWLVAIVTYIFKQSFALNTSSSILLAVFYILLTFLFPFLFMEVL